MCKTLNGFKKFVEDMDNTPEKSREIAMGQKDNPNKDTQGYFASLGDEQNIEWDDLTQALESEPWVSSHFNLGGMQHKLSAWQIVKGSLSPDGADIQLKPQRGDRSYLKGNRLNKSKYEDNNRYHLNREELEKFLTSGWQPALAAAQAGGDPTSDPMGAPPM